jgi:cytochrome b561
MNTAIKMIISHLRNTDDSWGWLAMAFHWITVITVMAMVVLGLWMTGLSYYDVWYKTAPALHKSIGVLLFLLTLARLAWRCSSPLPAAIASHSPFEKKAARRMHLLLYLVLFCVMLSGYLISTADGRAVEVFTLFEIPAIIYGMDGQEDIAGDIHFALAILLIGLVAVHAGAAIRHHFVDKDRTLKRMLGL